MLRTTIERISKEFIKEAMLSPSLIEDMAAMEKYMAESYSGRVFVELLQNADDAFSKKISITNVNNDIIFANDGRSFTSEDIISISRSGASKKKRGSSIGYRGIGFKSTTSISDEIQIYSSNVLFSFSKKETSLKLGVDIGKVPVVRIPFLIEKNYDETYNSVLNLEDQGYTTFFIFKNAKIKEFLKEISEIDENAFLFLKNVERCSMKINDFKNQIELHNKEQEQKNIISFIQKNKQWLVVSNGSTKLAFEYIDGKICACDIKDAVYHSFLPTTEDVGYNLKINSDFSTDPSRKHIFIDEYTEQSIYDITDLILELIEKCLFRDENEEMSNLLTILSNRTSFSLINVRLYEEIKKRLTESKWLKIDGEFDFVSKYKLMPSWLEQSEMQTLRINSKYIRKFSLDYELYTKIPDIEKFLSDYSTEKYQVLDFINIISEKEVVLNANIETYAKIISNIVSGLYLSRFTLSDSNSVDMIFIKLESGFKRIFEVDNEKIDLQLQELLSNLVSANILCWFFEKHNILTHEKNTRKEKLTLDWDIRSESIPLKHISKWRAAEQQCLELEESFGNSALDVSKRNLGYDIESVDKDGLKRYIEVKSVATLGSEFSITNNEYTAAHQYGDQYYICIIVQNETELNVVYIKNPLEHLEFEKKIRQWEWTCDKYKGQSLVFKF